MSADAAKRPGWRHESGRRLTTRWVVKTVGITGFNAVFFAGYFYVLHHPRGDVTTMPLLALDHWIPFQSFALLPYVSLWIYVSLAPGLLTTARECAAYALTATVVALTGLGIFYAWPTAVPVMTLDDGAHPAFDLLKTIDASGNACPSLHVAFAVLTACRLHATLHKLSGPATVLALNWIWAVAIIYSTLATKQHVVLDVLAGALLGLAGAGLYQRIATAQRNCSMPGSTHA